jgi:hypothetical protein
MVQFFRIWLPLLDFILHFCNGMAFQTGNRLCDEYRRTKYGCGKKSDFIHPTYHENWFHKDIAAGAVFFASNSNNYRFNHIRAPIFFSIVHIQSRMAKTTKKEPLDKKNNSKAKKEVVGINRNSTKSYWESFHLIFCCLLSCFYLYIHGQEDQSAVLTDNRSETVQNWLGKFGAFWQI